MTEIPNSGPNFFGDLIDGSSLDEVAKERAKTYSEVKINPSEKTKYMDMGWSFEKQLRNSVIMRKEKGTDKLLEDDVWLVFKNVGFEVMNKDRNFKISVPSRDKKQIDVFAKDEYNAFVIFCTSQEKEGLSNSLKSKIHEISDLKIEITAEIQKHFREKIRVSFIIVTKNILWNKTDEQLASEKRIFFWKEDELEAYKMLGKQLDHAAKYQMYSILFGDRVCTEVGKIKVPAMRGGKGKEKYYLFLMHPEELFKIAYVHRREKSNPQEIRTTYQRMVNKKRLDEIGEFIDNGHQFPNNIILSFKQKPTFEQNPKIEDVKKISYGLLIFPPYYGCAWIVDGQHRLYGYTKSQHAAEHTLPVVAFENLDVNEQANLFVDINEKQKAVNKNLLWELYPDIYEGSEKEESQQLCAISLIAQRLNSEKDSVFYKHIEIPSILLKNKEKEECNLTLTNICDAIKENNLITRGEGLLFEDCYENSIKSTSEKIEAYFSVFVEFLRNDWENGRRGLIRTNNGIRVLFIIFRQLLKYLKFSGKEEVFLCKNLTKFKEETKTIIKPILEHLKNIDSEERDDIRKGSNKALMMRNTQKLLWELKEQTGFGMELWVDGKGWSPPIPKEEDNDELIRQLINKTLLETKKFIIAKLKAIHQEKWWVEGVPQGIKENIQKNIASNLTKYPYKAEEFKLYSYENKFLEFSSPSDLKEVIKYGKNWHELSHIFGDAEYASSQFKSFENIRNMYVGHEERKVNVDEIEKKLGYWGTKWIRRCVGLDVRKQASN
jgi:DGQHR domain-containing protein